MIDAILLILLSLFVIFFIIDVLIRRKIKELNREILKLRCSRKYLRVENKQLKKDLVVGLLASIEQKEQNEKLKNQVSNLDYYYRQAGMDTPDKP